MTITPEQIVDILAMHQKWYNDEKGGKRANLYGADLRSANLEDANLRGADLRSANLEDANLYGADLRSANLEDANLRGADLRSANLEDANLYGANLRSANLEDANLRGADLRSANLYGADLRSANLEDANLYGADLRSANLEDANLYGADLRSANLYGAKMSDTLVLVGDKPVLSIGPIGKGWMLLVFNTNEGLRFSAGCQQLLTEKVALKYVKENEPDYLKQYKAALALAKATFPKESK